MRDSYICGMGGDVRWLTLLHAYRLESGDLGYMKEDEEEHEEIVVICPPFAGRDEESQCI